MIIWGANYIFVREGLNQIQAKVAFDQLGPDPLPSWHSDHFEHCLTHFLITTSNGLL